MSRILISITGAAAYMYAQHTPVLNESKRRFYAETTDVSTVPGNTSEETQLLGPREVVGGMTVRLTPILEGVFEAARKTVENSFETVESYVNDGKTSLYATERQVLATVQSLHHRSEDLMPNAIYVAVAALTGQIMARNRGFVAKAVLPVGLGLGAFKYFLPHTFAHTTDFVWKAEQRAMPGLASTQGAAVEKAEKFAKTLEESAVKGQEKYYSGVESLQQNVRKFTGLNLSEEVSDK
ncbi:hypothetical protein PUMCH_002754 [Australozyma saopauloensis]|uniref:MICOS complex subunit n=1 Tax=Australozyma saopauloensis TaxID=291208 RepID=A0AAX4HC18_9ASCO|nr:hypothetical protein PUMCH_002754 [[Candida] saopauloensis]